jgi:O-6-methylguanine DNA methyltransferase
MKLNEKARLTDFELAVLKAALQIPFGETRTYAWIARHIGKPKAVRAVGSALRKNPWPIIIPCHRVIKSDGSLGKYAGKDTGRKKELIGLERTIRKHLEILPRKKVDIRSTAK